MAQVSAHLAQLGLHTGSSGPRLDTHDPPCCSPGWLKPPLATTSTLFSVALQRLWRVMMVTTVFTTLSLSVGLTASLKVIYYCYSQDHCNMYPIMHCAHALHSGREGLITILLISHKQAFVISFQQTIFLCKFIYLIHF